MVAPHPPSYSVDIHDPSPRYDTISFLSDYGLGGEFVGVVKSVIRQIAPAVTVIDVTHDIPVHDVRAGGLALARSAQYLCPGVVLAVVDPGVGTERRPLAVEVGDGASFLVGPDNGLLAPAVAMVGGATRAFALDRTEYHLPAPGATFDGRDVFAPVAAHLCAGVDPLELGTEISPAGLFPGVLPFAERTGERIETEILWVDRFGNAQLNVGPDDIADLGDRLQATVGGQTHTVIVAEAYASVGVGRVGLVVDSYGMLALVADRSSAADELGLGEGDQVVLEPAADDDGSGSVPVTLGPTRGTD